METQNIAAVSREFAKVFPKWTGTQLKIFFILLGQMEWRFPTDSNVMTVENIELKKKLGRKDQNEISFASYIRKQLKDMEDTKVELPSIYHSSRTRFERIISDFFVDKHITSVTLNPYFLRHFSSLLTSRRYVTYWIPDILKFRSEYSIHLYIALRSMQKYGKDKKSAGVMEVDYGTRQLKQLFGLSINDYMRKKNGKMVFDRSAFEKRTIKAALEEISRSRLIEIFPPAADAPGENCDLYRKTRKGKNISKYYFRFKVRDEVIQKELQLQPPIQPSGQ